ncbi:hypothetical protein B566_EDAN010573 [Ephemera danica]|nr:hypothetical protein B566_EDAN010573 [Ephemera danica]
MADEDEVDVLGDFTFDNLFPKEDSRISACYDGGVLGSQGADQLLHDCINPAWLLEPSQPCWFSPPHDERQRTSPASADDRSALGFTSLGSAGSPSNWEEGDSCWSRVAQFVGSKSPQQVRSQARLMGLTGVSSVSESSEQQEEEEHTVVAHQVELQDASKQQVAFTFSELIDDMAIPASMEEVIAVVTTAQPTVQGRGGGKRGRPRKNTVSESQGTTTIHECEGDLIIALPGKHTLSTKDSQPIRVVSQGEELIRIQKENEESEDSEIEIDDDSPIPPEDVLYKLDIKQEEVLENIKEEVMQEEECVVEKQEHDVKPELCERVFELPVPRKEAKLEPDVITDQEKEIHHEFFLGRATKTPSRYLKVCNKLTENHFCRRNFGYHLKLNIKMFILQIRNYIIDSWLQNKPKYTSKTSVRSGLRNCGDVNCIGRIHAYLEMVGAINFGCGELIVNSSLVMENHCELLVPEQTQYRPIVVPLSYTRGASTSSYHHKVKQDTKLLPGGRPESGRPRKKKTDFLDSDGEGGYTITHDSDGSVIYARLQHEPRKEHKERKSAHEQLRLVFCHKFSENHPAPYSVVLDVGALLLMDVHAHACRSEVIGLLGGSYDANSRVLHISRGVACKSQSTGVQCDMCPVSQTEASEQLQGVGLEVVGWYHSHPTFLPNPSLQDLDTQLKVQTWFAKTDSPFVGFILSPYFHGNKTPASSFKCLIVVEEGEERKPYQFPVQVSASQTCSASLVHRISEVFQHLGQGPGSEVVPFHDTTAMHPSITYIEKVVESVRVHIDQCQPPLSKEDRANLLTGIIEICAQHSPPKSHSL